MSFETAAAAVGRRPLVIVEIDADTCTNSYGVAPCTAAGQLGQACFNTYGTCQDKANFTRGTRTWRFCELMDVPPEVDAIPCVQSVNFAPAQIEPGGLGSRASVSISLMDFPFGDTLGSDPYRVHRGAEPRGTFWGRWLARNPHWLGRTLRIREGFINRPFTLSDFRTRQYVIESISGPDRNGRIRITGKDVLKLADDNRAQVPAPTTTKLDGAITNVATTVVLDDATGYIAGDRVAIEKEIVVLGTKSTNTFTGCTRGADGTTAEAHGDDSKVQKCLRFSAVNVRDVLETLLVTYSGIPSGYIDTDGWDAEQAASLATFDLTATLAKPMAVKQLLEELLEQCQVSIWWDDLAQLVRLKGETPFSSIAPPLNDAEHFIADSVDASIDEARQITHVEVYYGKRSPTEDDGKAENYQRVHVEIDADAEAANAYGSKRIKRIFSRWFTTADQTLVELTAQRLVNRFVSPPVVLTFSLDARHAERVQLGDVSDLSTRQIQGVHGDPKVTRAQVIKIEPKRGAHEYALKALAYFAATDAVITDQTISANTTNYSLFTALGGPSAPVTLTLTINAGVTVSSNNTAKPALDLADLHPDSVVTIVNNGTVIGHGGGGGDASDGVGRPGGDAISLGCNVTINNLGQISGGGGGGGAGGTGWAPSALYGGGGGAGNVVGPGGVGSVGTGNDGTATTGGTGYSGPGFGAVGGDLGTAGGVGMSLTNVTTPFGVVPVLLPLFAGGAAGACVATNGFNVTWAATGVRHGAY